MKLYILIHLQDVENMDANAKPFLTKEAAQEAMKTDWEATLKAWNIDPGENQTEERTWYCEAGMAAIRDDFHFQFESWKIVEHDLDVQVAVKVHGGQVQQIISNAGVSAEVYDMDASDAPDEGEQEMSDERAAEYEKLQQTGGWDQVW